MNSRFIHILLILSGLIALTSCISLPAPMSQEARLYIKKCGNCHAVYTPSDYSFKQWDRLFTLMRRGDSHRDMPPLNNQEWDTLRQYFKKFTRPG
jgi:hypothetical protein